MKLRHKGLYEGPRCWIPFDHAGPDGKALLGGWHYSTRVWCRLALKGLKPVILRDEIADKRLHLNDSAPSEGDWFYEYADKSHLSWVEKHGVGNVVSLQALNGDHPPEAQSDHPLHAEYKRSLGDDS